MAELGTFEIFGMAVTGVSAAISVFSAALALYLKKAKMRDEVISVRIEGKEIFINRDMTAEEVGRRVLGEVI